MKSKKPSTEKKTWKKPIVKKIDKSVILGHGKKAGERMQTHS